MTRQQYAITKAYQNINTSFNNRGEPNVSTSTRTIIT